MSEKEDFMKKFREWFNDNYPEEEITEVEFNANFRDYEDVLGVKTTLGRDLSVGEMRNGMSIEKPARTFSTSDDTEHDYDLVVDFS